MESIYRWQENLRYRSYLVIFLFILYVGLLSYLVFRTFVGGHVAIIMGLLLSLIITIFLYFSPQTSISTIFSAYPSDDYRLNALVENMKTAFGIYNVEVYIVPWPVINAFVVSSPTMHYLFVTEGALEKLDDRELEGVLAHEFAHMENKDSFYMTLASVVAGVTVLLSEIFLRKGEDDNKFLIIGFILALFAPIAVRILLSALSQQREFLADARAVEITKYPPGLIRALVKVSLENTRKFFSVLGVPSLFGALFFDFEDIQTHPPIPERIKKLGEITGTPVEEYLALVEGEFGNME